MSKSTQNIRWLCPPISSSADGFVYVGFDVLRQLPLFFPSVVQASRFAIVTDETVGNLFADELTQAFQECGMGVVPVFSFPAGEGFKTREVKSLVEDWLLEKKFLRDSCIIALGGGVVGDLAGFVAATYMRGIPVIQIPTTVLAMVDASIGGKTAVDVPAGKNLVGAFHHPNAVIIDIHLLRSLPDRHFYNGLAEIIKIGIVRDHELFVFMETHHEEILLRNFEALGFAIQRAAKAKSDIVKCDEKESGMRAILNFGHSIGHAIEALVGMESDGELLHGECVSIGMIYEALLARSMGFISTSTISRLENCLKLYHLPVSIPDHLSLRVNDIVEKMAVDKKNKGNSGMKNIVMLTGVGSSIENPWTKPVSDSQLKIVLCKSSLLISGKKAVGEVFVPGSKSVSNRILALAALGSGTTRIKGLLHSEDTHVMLDSLQKLGVKFEWKDAGSVLVLHGSGGTLQTPKEPLYLGNAGTASRFLTTIVTMVPGSSTILTGNSRMQERPISDLVDAIISTGCKIEYLNKTGSLPIRVFGGGFPGGEISLNANVSSQFVSSIMISAAHAKSPVRLKLIGDSVVSRPYIDMTTLLLRQFQIPVVEIDSNTFEIGQSKYINPPEILVEGDASSASYPLALAAITGGKVTVMNVGSSSTQGDAGFCHFLESMNCTVSQTESQTTVQGPDSNWDLRGVPEIDFEHLTDTFMTAAVVAAVANGVTRIRNISNQRVKECNRIQVMVEELTAIGIIAKELDDGIEIHGQPDISRLRVEGSHVKCHRDHRIAMSFAVLGAKVPNLIITDKACTGKTYPEFWDHLQLYLGLELDDRISDIVDKVEFSSMSHSSASIYIIGMRAAGKTTLGKVAAKHLGYQFVDLDEVIETMINGNIKRFVEENGWEEFRKVELKCLQMCSEKYKERCVISCGGGIVESPSAITILKSLPIVIMINRHIADIEADLSTESSRPKFSGTVRSVWQKRFPLLKSASNFEFYIMEGDKDWAAIQRDWTSFLTRITTASSDLHLKPESFFLSLTFSDLKDCVKDLQALCHGVDALEIRVDLLKFPLDLEYIQGQITLLRRELLSRSLDIPLIYTARSKGHGGAIELDNMEVYFSIIELGLRIGIEYLDIEVTLPQSIRRILLNRKNMSRIIGSMHLPLSNGGHDYELRHTFQQASLAGKADVLKVVTFAKHVNDGLRISNYGKEFDAKVPTIALAMGEFGKVSRVFNMRLTPVTHELMPFSAAPGQMTVKDIIESRIRLGVISPKQFFLFGSPIQLSPSPAMHNCGFKALCLPHHYDLHETMDPEAIAKVISSPTFGGASVTIPLKTKIFSLVDDVSDSAAAIGSINTLIKHQDGKISGDNTDWLAIYRLLERELRIRGYSVNDSLSTTSFSALVVGAGGTARSAVYALRKLNPQKIFVYNRSLSNAEKLVHDLGGQVLECLDDTLNVNVVVNTFPASIGWTAPPELLRRYQPLVFDVNYLPAKTELLRQAESFGCVTLRGISMLLEQGYAAFELWTGRHAPRAQMSKETMEFYNRISDDQN